MPVTPTWSIFYRNTSTPAALETESATQATSIETALSTLTGVRQILSFKWANAAARTAQLGMSEGDTGYQLDTNISYEYNGSSWIVKSTSVLISSGTITTQSTIDIDGMTGWTTYRLILDLPTASVSNDLGGILRTGGAVDPSPTGDYSTQILVGSGATAAAGQTLAQNLWISVTGLGARTDKYVELELNNMNTSARTIVHAKGSSRDAAANPGVFNGVLWNMTNTATWSGIRITTSTGTVTGTYRLYGEI